MESIVGEGWWAWLTSHDTGDWNFHVYRRPAHCHNLGKIVRTVYRVDWKHCTSPPRPEIQIWPIHFVVYILGTLQPWGEGEDVWLAMDGQDFVTHGSYIPSNPLLIPQSLQLTRAMYLLHWKTPARINWLLNISILFTGQMRRGDQVQVQLATW